jgi:tetratricopeptide (TPR) repeat protein
MSAGEWVLVTLDEKVAQRSGSPPKLPVPVSELETLSEKGLSADTIKKYIQQFLQQAPSTFRSENPELAARFDAYSAKAMFVERAEKAMQTGDTKAAVSALQTVVRLDKADQGARLNLAMALARGGNMPAAKAELSAISATFAGDPGYHQAFAEVLRACEERDASIAELVLALEAKPDFQPAMDTLAELGVLSKIYEDPQDARSLVYVRSDSLVEHFTQVFEARKTPQFLLEHLVYHEGDGRHPLVILAAERLLASPDATPAMRERAEVARAASLRALGRTGDALAAINAFLGTGTETAAPLVELAECLRAQGDGAAATAALERALVADPGDQLAIVARFWPADHEDLHGLAAAVPALRTHAQAHPDVPGVHRAIARAELALGNDEDALTLLGKAVQLAPKDDDLRAEWWVALGRTGRQADVVRDAEQLGNMKERSWRLRWSEAEAFAALGRKQEARAAFTALNLDESLHVDVRRRAKRAANGVG